MTAAPHPRTVAYFEETEFGAAPADWDASGIPFLCIDPDTSDVQQAVNDNQNYVQRPFATRESIHALRNSEFTFGIYATGTGVTTADAAQAATFYLTDFLRVAWGGRTLTYAEAVATPDPVAPTVTAAAGANYTEGQVVMVTLLDGTRRFNVIDDVTGDVLTFRWAEGQNITGIGATALSFIDGPIVTNRQNAGNVTHGLILTGDLSDDTCQLGGCSYSVTVEGLSSGEEAIFRFAGMCATFDNDGVTQPTLATAPVGVSPATVGSGQSTRVLIGDVDGAMTDVGAYSVEVTPGIVKQPVQGVGGLEGRHGYQAGGWNDTRVEITVPYAESWLTDFENAQHKQIMIQVGDARGGSFAFFFPNAEIYVDPRRGESQDETAVTLTFRPREYEGATATTGSDLELWRSKMVFAAGA